MSSIFSPSCIYTTPLIPTYDDAYSKNNFDEIGENNSVSDTKLVTKETKSGLDEPETAKLQTLQIDNDEDRLTPLYISESSTIQSPLPLSNKEKGTGPHRRSWFSKKVIEKDNTQYDEVAKSTCQLYGPDWANLVSKYRSRWHFGLMPDKRVDFILVYALEEPNSDAKICKLVKEPS